MTRPPGKPYASPNALRAAVVARANKAARADQRFTGPLLDRGAQIRLLRGRPGRRPLPRARAGAGPTPPAARDPGPPRCAPARVSAGATVADKLSGIFTRHGERLSTRYRDLVDLVTISLSQPLAARDVHTAIHEELGRQCLAVPAEFAVPDAEAWEMAYRTYAQGLPHLESIGFERAVALVKALLDPVLGGRRDGWWRPEHRAWEPMGG